ncbi:hypothetical protein RIF23_00355 [Lipingzhangella sp. LS1_29]|uniref:Phospholipase/carboxylesterase/thioesterase domain-containing protein n=1 Tax=Lipingzhangella rawalii TaxID=2055835 RepID=A0ABU2H0A7_9ACTN|nr:dienelactone hydrolase family protein [Lipingzhangella rawalii]MDS1268739.1 hypothetical protein [Lipingzhangella rawalii]
MGASPVVAVGFSNGASIAAALLLTHPGVLRAAVLLAAGASLQDRSPEQVDLSGTAVFLAAGMAGPIIPIDQAQLLVNQLTDRGAAVTFRSHPGGHGAPPPEVLRSARGWLATVRAARGGVGRP